LNDEEPFFEPLPAHSKILTSRKAATMDAKKRQSAGLLVFMAAILFATAKITNPGYNRVLNQQKVVKGTKDVAGDKTLFSSLSFVQPCDCKAVVRAGGYL